jgi:putative PIN family toxin of toxin-antitoxin system
LFAHVLVEHEVMVGEVVLTELRAKLRERFKVPGDTIEEIEALLRGATVVPRPAKHLNLGIRDADDEWVVAAAVAGGADALVTGDADVLAIADRAPLRIVNPRALWELLRSATAGK